MLANVVAMTGVDLDQSVQQSYSDSNRSLKHNVHPEDR